MKALPISNIKELENRKIPLQFGKRDNVILGENKLAVD